MKERAPPEPAPSSRRKAHLRYVLVGLAATLHQSGRAYPCTVRNISAAGLMASLYEIELDPGRVEIEFAGGERVAGAILWARDWNLGLAFDHTIDVEAVLASSGGAQAQLDRRTDRRHSVDCAAKLRVSGRFYFGRVVDISCSGARFRTSGPLKKLGSSLLSVPDLPPLPCVIRWARGPEIGVQFDEPVPETALDRWLAARLQTERRETGEG